MMFRFNNTLICVLLFIASFFVFVQGLNVHGPEYRDDEIFYFKSTQDMLATGNVMSPKYFGEDRFQKPILFYWLILISYKIFGVNWFAARCVSALFAGLAVCLTWLIANDLFGRRRMATLSAVIVMTVPLFFRHAKNAVPDMALNFFIVMAIYYGFKCIKNPEKLKHSVLFFVACGLGFMIKGFAAFIAPMGTILLYALFTRNFKVLSFMRFGRGFFILAAIILPWFLFMIKTHGASYVEYMLVTETKSRLVGGAAEGAFVARVKMFLDHSLFYLKTIFNYFAPWSLFFFAAIPLTLKRVLEKRKGESEALLFLLSWVGVVFFFFSNMYFIISHYMLVLSTPFAILTSYFLLESLPQKDFIGKAKDILQKNILMVIFSVGFFVYCFIGIFLAGFHKAWLLPFAIAYVFSMRTIFRSQRIATAPLALGILMLFVFAQSTLIGKAGMTSHAALQKFAHTIKEDTSTDVVIGVGSHDIHEKEFQVYFDQQVKKSATSEDQETKERLVSLLNEKQKVYCLLTEKDFNNHLINFSTANLDILQEDYMLRKHLHIDKNFFAALLKLDKQKVHDYFMEKIILVRKDKNV